MKKSTYLQPQFTQFNLYLNSILCASAGIESTHEGFDTQDTDYNFFTQY